MSGKEMMSKKKSQIPILTTLGPVAVAKILRNCGSLREGARKIGVHHVVLARYCRKNGITIPNAMMEESRRFDLHFGAYPKWLRENPGVSLPKSIRRISEITGCTADEIKSYMYRRRRETREVIRTIPDLRKGSLMLKTLTGEWVDTSAIAKYNYVVNHWSCETVITLAVGGQVHMVPVPDIKEFKKDVLQAIALTEKNKETNNE